MNQALITALAAVAGFLGKSLWDMYWKRREEVESLARQKRIDFLERQLSQFYWPLYLHLQENNVIWEHLINGKAIDDSIKQSVDSQLRKVFFLQNHDVMVKIIESNAHLAQPDPEFENVLMQYIRHATIYRTIREVGLPYDPIAVKVPWPGDLFQAVEIRLKSLQQEYDREIKRASGHDA